MLGEIFHQVHRHDESAHLRALGDSINNWLNLDPHTIIFLFLPPLIYESAASLNYYTFSYSIHQTLLLAIPGVMISAVLTALIAMYLLPYGWDFTTGMTLGSILAATDPVAVVALLRELGAPRSLATIIEGESLLNDGIAFVLFQYFLTEMESQSGESQQRSQTTGDFFIQFVYMSVVGVAVGWCLGRLVTFLQGLVFDDTVAIVMMSVSGAFSTFYLVDGVLEASGVLGVVAFGLAFAKSANGNISSSASEALEIVWESLGFGANTLVFVYSGIIIADRVFHSDLITIKDYGYLMLLYVGIQVIRALSLAIQSPLLSRLGYGFTWRQGILFTWSGLRGAVGLTLGLFVISNPLLDSREDRERIMFYVAGIAGLTLLINGTTASLVVKTLELNRGSAAAKVFYYNAIRRFQERMENKIAVARRSDYFRGADWTTVWSHMPMLSHAMRREVEAQMLSSELSREVQDKIERLLRDIDQSYMKATSEEVERTLVQDARYRFLNLVKAGYNAEFEHGALESRPAFQILIDAATASQDMGYQGPNVTTTMTTQCEWHRIAAWSSVSKWVAKIPWIWLKHLAVDWRLSLGFELASIFIKVHLSVEREFIELVANEQVVALVLDESHEQLVLAQEYLDDLNTNFADITGAFKTRWATQWVLRDTYVYAQELYDLGEIGSKELQTMLRGVKMSRGLLFQQRFSATKPQERIQVLKNCELFESLSPDEVREVVTQFHEREFLPDELLAVEHEPSKGVFVITNGKVEMSKIVPGSTTNESAVLQILTSGSIVGNIALVTRSSCRWTMTCSTNVRGYFMKQGAMCRLLEKARGQAFERNFYAFAGIELLQHWHVLDSGMGFTPVQQKTIFEEAEICRFDEAQDVIRDGGTSVLFYGQCREVLEEGGEGEISQSSPDDRTTTTMMGTSTSSFHDAVEHGEWVTSGSKFEFQGKWHFEPQSCIMWIPPYVSWSLEDDIVSTQEDIDETMPRSSSIVEQKRRMLRRCRSSVTNYNTPRGNKLGRHRNLSVSYMPRHTPRAGRFSRRSYQQQSSNNVDIVGFEPSPRVQSMHEAPLLGINGIYMRMNSSQMEDPPSSSLNGKQRDDLRQIKVLDSDEYEYDTQ